MKKRHIIFISLIVFGLLIAIISITYALNTTVTEGTSTDYDLLYTFDINGGSSWNVTVASGKTKVYEIALNNPYNDSIKYGVIYKVNNYDTTPEGVSVTTTKDSTSLPEDLIGSDANKSISVMIKNTTSSSITVTLGIVNGYKNGGNLILPSGYSIVELPASAKTLTNLGLTSNGVKSSFANVATTDEGIFETQDDLGKSYYFRGAVENNYVYFAGFYWRIIRINGDGIIRMIYDGTSAYDNGEYSEDRYMTTTKYNSSYNDNAYVGYMYGTTGASTYAEAHANTNDSTIKDYLDSWYETNIEGTTYEQYVVDAIYCNDRKIDTNAGSLNGYTGYTTLGYGTNKTVYAATARVGSNITNPSPTLLCAQDNDKFTVSSNLGNGDLTYPIGLITADEVAMAGGVYGSDNSSYYLYTGNWFWTMSPNNFYASDAGSFLVHSSGYLSSNNVTNNGGARGVISLKADAIKSGSGTASDPFSVNPPANSPDLVEGLIPVKYDETTSSWVVADKENSNSTYQWYDYNNKKWANAVLVTSTNRSTYQNASAGTAITESDILAFYVWIPRYKYKVWNINKVVGTDSYNARTTGIDIVFESEKEKTGTITCTYSYASPSSSANSPNETCTGSNGDYYTHPAFTFGSDEVRGFWIGKYEVSSSNPQTGSSYGGGNSTSLQVKILPNVTSWRYNPVSNQSTVIQNMQTSSNIYGLNTSRTNTDSHMLTNYEWGAVAYLTNSKYGRCTNGSCTEVAINGYGETGNYTTKTGCGPIASGSTSYSQTCNAYNTTLGMTASTTGNVYGVYDMSGGAFEYVMGNMSSASGSYTFSLISSNFASSWYSASTAKYIITYANGSTFSDQTAYNRGRLGDATGEVVLSTGGTGGWYSDYAFFPYSSSAWFLRGGALYTGSNAGPFGFYSNDGYIYSDLSSRAALIGLS